MLVLVVLFDAKDEIGIGNKHYYCHALLHSWHESWKRTRWEYYELI